MSTEPNTGLTFLPSGALQPDLVINAVIKYLNSGFRPRVLDKDLGTPPTLNSTTDVGKAYIIPSGATGVWSGKTNQVAYWNGLTWDYFTPAEGWTIAVLDEDSDYRHTGSAWAIVPTSAFSGGNLTSAVNEAKFADIASAATTNIGGAAGNYGHITGTTTITALGTAQAGSRRITVFDGALTLTHNATSMILITGANITTAAGDVAEWESEGSGNWRMVSYQRKDGTSLGGSPSSVSSVNTRTGAVTLTAADTPATINEQTASYTLVLGDAGKWVDMNNASSNNMTVPPNSSVSFAVGTEIYVRQKGAGATTIVAGSGVTVNKPASQTLVLKERYAVACVKKIDTDVWTAFGLLT